MARADGPLLQASVARTGSGRCDLVEVRLPSGSTLRDAVLASGLHAAEPALDPDRLDLGVYGKARAADAPLQDGDRVEIYRQLTVDPKEARRIRAKVRRRRAASGNAGR